MLLVSAKLSFPVLWQFRNDRPVEIVEPHPRRDAFITTHSSRSLPQVTVTIFHARSPVPQMVHTLPFAIRNLVWYPRLSAPVSESFSLVGLTHNYSLILMGDAVDAQEGPSAPSVALWKPVPPKRSLFEEMFGVPAITNVSVHQSHDHSNVHPAVLPWRSSETASFFDAPSHLMPSMDTFFDSLVDSFLHLRTTDTEPQTEPDFQPEVNAAMSVDEEPNIGKSTGIPTELVLQEFTPVFKEIAGSYFTCDVMCYLTVP